MFEPINKIKNTKQKKFFIEKVNIYLRFLEELAVLLKLKFDQDVKLTDKTFDRLKRLKIFNSDVINDNKKLINILKINQYKKLIAGINFNIKNKDEVEKFLIKFYQPKKIKNKKKFSIVDFFCGAGGLSYGFSQENFNIVLANDNDPDCIETYKFNHPDIDKNKVILEDIKIIIKKIDKIIKNKVDVVVGGPPCQGFSNVNQQRIIMIKK